MKFFEGFELDDTSCLHLLDFFNEIELLASFDLLEEYVQEDLVDLFERVLVDIIR